MSFLDRWFSKPPDIEAMNTLPIESPWAPTGLLNSVVWPDILGLENMPLSRAEAVSVPTVARAKGLITSTVARFPLTAYRDDEDIDYLWMNRTDGPLSPFHRMSWTVDDLLFYGWSLWTVQRNTQQQVVQAARISFDRWEFDTEGRIIVDGNIAPSNQVVLIPGPHEGLLSFGSRTVRQATNLLKTADKAAATPNAFLELHQTNEAPMTEQDVALLIEQWSKARRGENGGVAFTNNSIEVKEHGAANEHLLIEGRNASAVDIARCMGVPAALLDAQAQKGSLTYETTVDRVREFVDFGLLPYMEAIAGRLSQDDVCPRGVRVRFDLQELLGDMPMSANPTANDVGKNAELSDGDNEGVENVEPTV